MIAFLYPRDLGKGLQLLTSQGEDHCHAPKAEEKAFCLRGFLVPPSFQTQGSTGIEKGFQKPSISSPSNEVPSSLAREEAFFFQNAFSSQGGRQDHEQEDVPQRGGPREVLPAGMLGKFARGVGMERYGALIPEDVCCWRISLLAFEIRTSKWSLLGCF